MMTLVLINPPLAQSRDLPIAHAFMNERGFDPETLRDGRRRRSLLGSEAAVSRQSAWPLSRHYEDIASKFAIASFLFIPIATGRHTLGCSQRSPRRDGLQFGKASNDR